MASEVASAFVSILPSAKGFGSKLESQVGGQTEKAGRSSGKRFGSVFASASITPLRAFGAAAVGLFAIDKVKDFFSESIAEARESQKVGAITAQVIKSTGGAAKISATEVGALATAISNKTGIDDEAVQSASNLLLTFRNVKNEVGKGNDVFNQATQAATDMGAALGKDPKAAAIQLGKALNDPVKGIAALGRAGVQFTAQQKQQIKTMVASGNTLGAQKLILGELNKEFGGTAAAAATNGEKLDVAFGNLKEQIGTALLPVIDKVEGAITSKIIPAVSGFITGIQKGTGAGGRFRSFIEGIGTTLKPVADFITKAVIPSVQLFFGTLTGQGADVDLPWMNTIIDLASSVSVTLSTIGAGVRTTLGQIGTALAPLGQTVAAFATIIISRIVPAIAAWYSYLAANLVPIFTRVVGVITGSVLPIVARLASFFVGTVIPAVLAIAQAVAARLKPVLNAIFQVIQTQVIPAVQQIAAKFMTWLPTIEAVIKVIIAVVGFVLKLAAAILGTLLPPLIKLAAFLIVNVVKAVVAVIGIVIKIIGWMIKFGAAVGAAWSVVTAATRAAVAIIRAVVTAGFRVLGVIVSTVMTGIRTVVSGAWRIITTLFRTAVAVVKAVLSGNFRAIPGIIRSALGQMVSIASSTLGRLVSLVHGIPGRIRGALGNLGGLLTDAGRQVVNGLVNGIRGAAGRVADAARALADKIPGPVRHAMGIHSPSRVMITIGKQVTAGLIKGLEGDADKVKTTATKLSDLITKGLARKQISRSRAKTIGSVIAADTKLLITSAKQRATVASKLADAQQKLTDAVRTRDDFAASVKSSLIDAGSVVADSSDGAVTAKSIIQKLSDQVAATKVFGSQLDRLKRAGLNQTTYSQLLAAGVDEGGKTAAALLAGGSSAIRSVNNLTGQLIKTSTSIGQQGAKTLYQAGVDSAAGLAQGLASQSSQLATAASMLAKNLVAAVKKALGIRSPSRVFAEQVGRHIPTGVIRGIDSGQGRLDRRVASLVRPPQLQLADRAGQTTAGQGGVTVHGDVYGATPRQIADQLARQARLHDALHPVFAA